MSNTLKKGVPLTHFIIAGAMAWGRGETCKEALMNWLHNGSSWQLGSKNIELKVWQVDKDATVDGMGTLHYVSAHELPTVLVTYEFRKKLEEIDGDIEEMFLPHIDEEIYEW